MHPFYSFYRSSCFGAPDFRGILKVRTYKSYLEVLHPQIEWHMKPSILLALFTWAWMWSLKLVVSDASTPRSSWDYTLLRVFASILYLQIMGVRLFVTLQIKHLLIMKACFRLSLQSISLLMSSCSKTQSVWDLITQ